MTDAPFTETHRATLDQWLTNPLAVIKSPDLPLDDAIRAALAEIDRLRAETGLLRRSLEMLVKDTARRDVTTP